MWLSLLGDLLLDLVLEPLVMTVGTCVTRLVRLYVRGRPGKYAGKRDG